VLVVAVRVATDWQTWPYYTAGLVLTAAGGTAAADAAAVGRLGLLAALAVVAVTGVRPGPVGETGLPVADDAVPAPAAALPAASAPAWVSAEPARPARGSLAP
jgi:hypothetical protein